MRKLLIILLCLGLFACQSENKKQEQGDSTTQDNGTETDTLTYSYDVVKVISKNLVTVDEHTTDTTRAVITYPRFNDEKLDKLIEQRVCEGGSNPDRSYNTYAELANSFVKGFDDYLTYNEDNIQTWFLEVKVDVIRQHAPLLALKFSQADYMGGAHPNSSISYVNYDRRTRSVLTLDSILKPNTLSKLQAVAEQIFRKNEGLTPTQSLAGAYFFENDQFHLNSNFTITPQGLEFLYNPYEIKPYAAGVTRLLIPYASIKDLIQANSPINRIANNAGI